jgi:hypothetical protein
MFLSTKRKSGYKRDLIIFFVLSFSILLPMSLLLITVPKEDISSFAAFVFPALLLFDFSVRFFWKKQVNAAILPYLCLPIPHKTLISYMILSDLQNLWIWGCWLLYGIILYVFGTLTFANAIALLFLLLINNYLTTFVKVLIKGYAILAYPVCTGFVCLILFVLSILNPFFDVIFSFSLMLFLMVLLYYALKEDLYDELNRFAL